MQERKRRVDELARRYSVMMVVPSRGQAILPKAEERRRKGSPQEDAGGMSLGGNTTEESLVKETRRSS